MEFDAIVYKVLAPIKGTSARGEWTKQEIVFELPGEFSRKVCVGFWGDKAADAAALKEGEQVSVSINIESKEYNGRWFTEVRAWKFAKKSADMPSTGAPVPPPVAGGFPPISAPDAEPYKDDAPDDLPF